jgi:uncharacterized CHY-type Zn-finger protein
VRPQAKDIHGERVFGDAIDGETRCVHYHGETDIIAIKFRCCGKWYPCFDCHSESADHDAQVWTQDQFSTKAILCGRCGHQLSIDEYFACGFACPNCAAAFNPACARHYNLYFEQ